MYTFRLTALSSLCCFVAAPAWAQFEEVIVTGSRISGDDYSNIPAVTLEKRADFLVQRIRLTNDTRAEDVRRKELYQTIRDLLADGAKRGMALGYGDEFLIPIAPSDYEVALSSEGKRPDTSSTELYVKMALAANDNRKARVSGRTEIEPQGEIGLSIVKPEKYRYEIIAKIAEDAMRLQSSIAQCRMDIAGLSNRVSWQRSDISQLTLYIPYEIQLTGCQ